jgi:ammonium transporter Rh
LWVLATIEVIFYCLNEAIVIEIFKIADIGGSIVIHTFGAVFGIAASFFFQPSEAIRNKQGRDGSTYNSDIVAMIGTLFLWMYWPSFNAATGEGS